MPREQAIAQIKEETERTYARKGKDIVKKNFEAIDAALANMHKMQKPRPLTSRRDAPCRSSAPEFVRRFTVPFWRSGGNALPVSALPGTYPTGTTKY